MPCPDLKTQVEFYKELGFNVLGEYTTPNAYAALGWRNIELHFWGSRKVVASKNSTMCYMLVDNVDEVNESFTAALKKFYGRVPRTGFPKITKVRSLVGDRRFTLTDPGGNTLFIGVPSTEADRFFRTLESKTHAKLFAVLYDVLYSKEDPDLANSMLPKYMHFIDDLDGLDKAKFLLLVIDIQVHVGNIVDDHALKLMIHDNDGSGDDWNRIKLKLQEIFKKDE